MSLPFCSQARAVVEAMADAVLLVDEQGRIVFVNAQAETLFCAPREALVGRSVETLVPDEQRSAHAAHRARFFSNPRPRRMGTVATLRARRPDGSEVPVDISLSTVPADGGRLVLACVRDVTWREELHASLVDSERRYRMVVEGASEVFYQVLVGDDPTRGQVGFVSPQCRRLTGCGPDDFVANPACWIDLVHPDDRQHVFDQTRAILAAGREGTRYYRIRHVAEGGYRYVADRTVPLIDAGGRVVGYQGVARDVTERVQSDEERRVLDRRLQQAERMEALGRLAGGVAHDFNNLLTIILGFCETARAASEPESAARGDVEEIARAARRAADLTRQLLGFGRRQVIAPTVVDLNAHLTALREMLRRTLPEHVTLDFRRGADLWPVFVDRAQVDQILINLVANARDAMPGGGSLVVETANGALDEAFSAANPGCTPGDYVQLTVSDTGTGMDEETASKAFEPFFTTKAEGRGTGIGLASVYGIVKQNRGYVRLESAVNRGTTVSVYLPRYLGDRRPAADEAPRVAIEGGRETVLVVEDDDLVRAVTRRLLARLGYQVLEAGSPSAALSLCTSHEGTIDLLLTDVVMPEMNGLELARLIRRLRPGIATLLMSGHASNLVSSLGGPDAITHLAKPFDEASLAASVRAALGRG
jgi:hypothetical protein